MGRFTHHAGLPFSAADLGSLRNPYLGQRLVNASLARGHPASLKK